MKTRAEMLDRLPPARREAVERQAHELVREVLLDEQQHDAFVRVLDDPPAPNERLKRLMSEPSPWEK